MDDGGWDGGCGAQGVCMTICEHHMTVYVGGIATARWDGVVAGWAVRRRDCVSGWWLDGLRLADGAGTECVTVWSDDRGGMEAYDILANLPPPSFGLSTFRRKHKSAGNGSNEIPM